VIILKRAEVFYNAKIYTEGGECQVFDSMAIAGRTVLAVGNNLQNDTDFCRCKKTDLKGRTVLPGFTDSHTHFHFIAKSLNSVKLDGVRSLDEVLGRIRKHAAGLKRNEWLTGEGFSPDRWGKFIMPDRYMLDKITGGHPAAIYSKDQHMMWVNSQALKLAGIDSNTSDPPGGSIERLDDGEPSGILMEIPGYYPVIRMIKTPAAAKMKRLYEKALQLAYSQGVTGIHSFDENDALPFYLEMSERGKLGLRINYYPRPSLLPELKKRKIGYGYGNDYLIISGIKMFADGSLGSHTAFCFNKYKGTKSSYGIEVTLKKEMLATIREASELGMPCAIHAIGDRAIANVLDCYEKAPRLKKGVFHRIEHLQMIRRSDIGRVKKLGVVASMQPSHCPSDIGLIEKYWGHRGRNCYLFNTLLRHDIPLIFGSDAPIETLNPLAGIGAAVNRTAPWRKKAFYPEERISVAEAVAGFTSRPAVAGGRAYDLGRLLPGYKADFIILSDNIYKVPRTRIGDVEIMATFFDGRPVYGHIADI